MIEPVHTTEMSTYMSCRLKHYFVAPAPRGRHLAPKVKKQELRIGGIAHRCLMEWYDSNRQEDIADLVEREVDKHVEGQGVTWPELRQKFHDEGKLLKVMLRGYTHWAKEADESCTILATETKWQVHYGPLSMMAGKFDGLIRRPDGLWVLEFKTTSSRPGGTAWASRALQNVSYAVAARELYGDVNGVLYRFLRKKAPWGYEDLALKSGGLTQRSNLPNLTTLSDYQRALMIGALRELEPDWSSDAARAWARESGGLQEEAHPILWERYRLWRAAHQEALANLKENGGGQFFWEQEEWSTARQRERYIKAVIRPMLKEMNHNPFPAPTGLGTSWALCGRCSFRTPCDLLLTGGDWRGELKRNYEEENETAGRGESPHASLRKERS